MQERITKMAKMEEEATHGSFRDRARQEYEERKAEGRLGTFRNVVIFLKPFHVEICSSIN